MNRLASANGFALKYSVTSICVIEPKAWTSFNVVRKIVHVKNRGKTVNLVSSKRCEKLYHIPCGIFIPPQLDASIIDFL